jgi:hypothetical protein
MAISEFPVAAFHVALAAFSASPLVEIATLPFPQAANGEKPYRARDPPGRIFSTDKLVLAS